MRTSIFVAAIAVVTGLALGGCVLWLMDHRDKLFGSPEDLTKSVYGIDVSAYQGNIDWPVLSNQNVDFVFIKATEGDDFVDKKFTYNWKNAHKTKLKVGAYHFFNFTSSGEDQARNYIKTVPIDVNALPPVVDLEFYVTDDEMPTVDEVRAEMAHLLDRLEKHYGKTPIIYSAKDSYDIYLSGRFTRYPIWMRNTVKEPKLSDGREWTFWQYSAEGMLQGYVGREKFIDLNKFNGNRKEFLEFVSQQSKSVVK